MLEPEYLEELPKALLELYYQAETDILCDMARRISTYDYWIPSAEHQRKKLLEMGMVHEDIIKELTGITGKSDKELKKLMEEAGIKTIESDNEIYKKADLKPRPLLASPELKAILNAGYKSTKKTFKNLTKTTANTATKQFENALDRAWMQIQSGGFDYNTAIRNAIKDLSEQGIGAVVYPSGHRDTIETAVRRAVVTGVNKSCADVQLERLKEMETDLVEVSAHAGARPEHAEWQGKVYSYSGESSRYPDFIISTGYGTGAGLCGWNCRHNFRPYIEGSPRTYSEDLLDSYNEKKYEYNGKSLTEYEASQIQRKIERNIRRWKREEAAMKAAELPSAEASAKIGIWSGRQKDFLKQTGLKADGTRTIVGKQLSVLASGKEGDRSASSIVDKVSDFNYADKKKMNTALKQFAEEKLESKTEYAVVFSPNGKKYEISGLESTVDITLAGKDSLKDAVVIHNHPKSGELSGDCFSKADFKGYFEYGLKELYVANHMGTYRMIFDGSMTVEEAVKAYDKAFDIVRNLAFENDKISLDYEQHETMKVLGGKLKHLTFERVW